MSGGGRPRSLSPRPTAASDQVHRTRGRRTDLLRDLGQHTGGHRVVDGQHRQRLATGRGPGDLHAGDVDARLAEDAADRADDTGPVLVPQHDHVVGEREVDVVLTDRDDLLEVLRAGQRAGDRHLLAVARGCRAR